MKTLKKLLCVVLSLVMVFGTFSIMANAALATAPTGAVDESKINVKFEIEQVDGTDMYTAVDNNIYKLTVYCDAKYGVNFLQVPIHFDKTKFAIVMADDADIMGNMMYSYDGNHVDIGDDVIYYYNDPESFSDTSMLNASGAAVTALRSAQYVGLGNVNATKVVPQWELVDATHPNHATWLQTLDANTTGIAFYCLDNTLNAKNAYNNAMNGAIIDGWADMGSIYFIRLDGVSEADAVGSVFGSLAGGYGVEGIWDESGKPSYIAANYNEGMPGVNFVSNAVVEEAKEPSPVFNKNSQIRFNAAPVGDAKADFDVRTRGYIAADALTALCGGNVTEDAITDIGFVFFAGEDIDLATAAEVAKNGSTGAYTRKQCSYVQATGSEYVWTCMVTDPAYDGTLQSVAYITVGGETYITDAAQETSFADLYDRNIDSYLGA